MNSPIRQIIEVIVIGSSAGGVSVLNYILSKLPKVFRVPIIIVSHLPENKPSLLANVLSISNELNVLEASSNMPIENGHIYVAPNGYHLLVEDNKSFSLSKEDKIHFCRPAIDVTFESIANVYGNKAVGVILTGANNDGAYGLSLIRQEGGIAVIQSPESSTAKTMPQAAIDIAGGDYVDNIENIADIILKFQSGS